VASELKKFQEHFKNILIIIIQAHNLKSKTSNNSFSS